MATSIATAEKAISRILERISEPFGQLAQDWEAAMRNGSIFYERFCGPNIRRLHLSYASNHIFPHLKADCSNLYQATVEAIESCKPEQYSVRKGIKFAAVSLGKFLVAKGE